MHGHRYEIRVRGHLSSQWAGWFDGLDVRPLTGGETLLCGQLRDQAALFGVLLRIRDVGLTLLSVAAADLGSEGEALGEAGA